MRSAKSSCTCLTHMNTLLKTPPNKRAEGARVECNIRENVKKLKKMNHDAGQEVIEERAVKSSVLVLWVQHCVHDFACGESLN